MGVTLALVETRLARPLVGIGYRSAIAEWTRANVKSFDVLEITVDHCIYGTVGQRDEIFDLVGQIPLNAHGIGLSIGTDVPLDLAYLDQVAGIVERLRAPRYSEHLAFTRVPGRDLANLLPLPRTAAVAESIIAKIRTIQSRVKVPFLLENISYVFEWPDSQLSDAEFLNLVCSEAGDGLLLDIENLHLNACNHGFDAYGFIDSLMPGLVKEVHMAGGMSFVHGGSEQSFFADSHSHPLETETLDLLERTLSLHSPDTIILERDDRLQETQEILEDVGRIRATVNRTAKEDHETATIRSTDQTA
jgi:uncharacterized protein (UPF0276 family)